MAQLVAIREFWAFARKDAALRESVVAASKEAEPLEAIARVASEAGFDFTVADLKSSLLGELTDQELRTVSAGAGIASLLDLQLRRLASPHEWFAE